MEQPKKPAPTRDISDLKARLGLAKGGVAPVPPPGAAPAPVRPTVSPVPGAPAGAAPAPFAPAPAQYAAPAPVPSPFAAPAPVAAPAPPDPYASFKPPAGRQFDLRPVDDGVPVENVRGKGSTSALIVGGVLGLLGLGVGFFGGGINVGRRFHNQANVAAKSIKTELDEMQKTVSEIGRAVAMSQQRLAAKGDPLAYDPQLIDELENVKVAPAPNTARVFKVNYFLLPDLAVDRLMNYYYDSIALYGEVERHVKRTRADKESLDAYAAKQAEAATKSSGNYGVVFDNGGKIIVANLVEVGKPVCKGGNEDCSADALDGFQIRAGAGSSWAARKAGGKLELGNVVPLRPTPLMDAVMAGSPEQVRLEAYRQRTNNIRLILARITATQKELKEAVDKAATRADLFAF